ncbi:MAG: Polysaccharide biosynthesis protein [Verrucomicrobiales bacterium]|nr:Polysaccharide biosynthesis protein [Verrucomicrobiales bacterium]
MVIATLISGACNWMASLVASRMPNEEFSTYAGALKMVMLVASPFVALQSVVAQSTGADLTPEQSMRARSEARFVLKVVIAGWLCFVVYALFNEASLVKEYKLGDSRIIWISLGLILVSLLSPLFSGILQGKQSFGWLGTANIAIGVGRVIPIFLALYFFHGKALSALGGVMLGLGLALAITVSKSLSFWKGPVIELDIWKWVGNVVPIVIFIFLLSTMQNYDSVMASRVFVGEQKAVYFAVMTLGQALLYFSSAISLVVFPKAVQAAARSEKTNVLFQAVWVTLVIEIIGALFCTFFPGFLLWLMKKPTTPEVCSLVTLYAWSVIPLGISMVFINNFIARKIYWPLPLFALVAGGYYWAVHANSLDSRQLIRFMGTFNAALLFCCLVVTAILNKRQRTPVI